MVEGGLGNGRNGGQGKNANKSQACAGNKKITVRATRRNIISAKEMPALSAASNNSSANVGNAITLLPHQAQAVHKVGHGGLGSPFYSNCAQADARAYVRKKLGLT